MLARLLLLLACLPMGCAAMFANKTTEEDKALNNFAEARQRAGMYYDSGDYVRAAEQYKRALEFRPDHVASRLGYAYSLMFTDIPSRLLEAKSEFEGLGKIARVDQETKRIYGYGLTLRSLAVQFQTRSRLRFQQGKLADSNADMEQARTYARQAIDEMGKVLASEDKSAVPLHPEAHAACAHAWIILGSPRELEPFAKAREHIESFATISQNARRYWEKSRERLLTTDPLKEGEEGDPNVKQARTAAQVRAYELALARLLPKELAMRRALVETYAFLNMYAEAIQESDVILGLDSRQDEVLLIRGRCYAMIEPPDYRRALTDLKEYRSRQDLTSLTENLVRLNRMIQTYEERLAEQEKQERQAKRPAPAPAR